MSGLKGSFDGFAGIDVSNDKSDVCGITGNESKLFQFSAIMDRKGFGELKGHLATVSISSVLIGMETNVGLVGLNVSVCSVIIQRTLRIGMNKLKEEFYEQGEI